VGITKQFPGTLANDHVDLTIERREIHALLGENGAGKSTLVKIIYGVLQPDSGTIAWQGERVRVENPGHARRLGIGMVFQHFSLFESLTVLENISLGLSEKKDRVGLRERIVEISTDYGLPVDPDRTVHDLSVGERQRIEIVRCLLQNPKLLVMDEPTSVLTPQEVDRLFVTLRRLADEGCSILYISHKLEEVRALCHTATVMRMGRRVASCVPAEKTAKELAEIMISAELSAPVRSDRRAASGRPRLVLDRLTVRSPQPFGTDLKDISLTVAGGEIVGIAGVAGNGQSELLDVLAGLQAPARGTLALGGARFDAGAWPDARRLRRLGLAHVPEDRHRRGLVLPFAAWESAVLGQQWRPRYQRHGWMRRRAMRADTAAMMERYDVRPRAVDLRSAQFSGGNQQKLVLARESWASPAVLLVGQPTRGVDIGAIESIHARLRALADAGSAVLVVSSDLDELLALADRVLVMNGGRIAGELAAADCSEAALGRLMGGGVPAGPGATVQP
jgi:simple sugar transport system ATP-binding protein